MQRRSGGRLDVLIHVEVRFGGFPIVGSFREESGDEAEEGGFVWKEGDDTSAGALSAVERAAFEFLVDAFEGVGGAEAVRMVGGEGKRR